LITYQGIHLFTTTAKTVVTIGTFDGVHLGHRKIIERLISAAKKQNCESVILTFFPHPRMVLHGPDSVQLLNTIEERIALLERCGVDHLIVHPFDEAFSKLSAEEFIKKVLVDQLHVQQIIVGHDHRFGNNRTADFNDLVLYGKQYGFQVAQIEAEMLHEVNVSSTKIRTALQAGEIELASQYLGHCYQLRGTVELGNQLGRTIGFPTANIHLDASYKLVPKRGVYLVQSTLHGALVFGLLNIGVRPTVGGSKQSIEVHFLGFEGDLYGQIITIELLDYLREEQKFDSVEDLKKQIESDRDWAIQAIASRKELAK
jgi:riboflavin kinase/FMN adenylyltransferase